MKALDDLAARAGTWRGTSTLQDPYVGIGEQSPSTAVVAPVGGGVRLDYTWAYRGEPQRGSTGLGVTP